MLRRGARLVQRRPYKVKGGLITCLMVLARSASHISPVYVGLGRDCAEKEDAVASCDTGPDSSSARIQVMIAEKGARD